MTAHAAFSPRVSYIDAIRLAENEVNPFYLSELAAHFSLPVRRAVAANSFTGKKTLFKMALKGEKWVCYDIMKNRKASIIARIIAAAFYNA